jgi:hypothetical protein
MPEQIQNLPNDLRYAYANWSYYSGHLTSQRPDASVRFIKDVTLRFKAASSQLRRDNGRPFPAETWEVPDTMPPHWISDTCDPNEFPSPPRLGQGAWEAAKKSVQIKACRYWHYARDALATGDMFGLGRAMFTISLVRNTETRLYAEREEGLLPYLPRIVYFDEGKSTALHDATIVSAPAAEDFPTYVAWWRAVLFLRRLIERFETLHPRQIFDVPPGLPRWRREFERTLDPRVLPPPQPPIPFDPDDRVFVHRVAEALRALVFDTEYRGPATAISQEPQLPTMQVEASAASSPRPEPKPRPARGARAKAASTPRSSRRR